MPSPYFVMDIREACTSQFSRDNERRSEAESKSW